MDTGYKKTIQKKISLEGIGIHTGEMVKLTLKPSDSGKVVFKRTDIKDFEFAADPKKVQSKNCSMLVTDKGNILTLEHLMAVLWVYGVDSLTVELDGGEIPVTDGSALPFIRILRQSGLKELSEKRRSVRIVKPFRIQETDGSVAVIPDSELKISYVIHYKHPMIKKQGMSIVVNPQVFEKEIAPARTFGFVEQASELRSRGLARGGSIKNTVVLNHERVISGSLRFPDEFVRHKILDFIGDLSLLGSSVRGHFMAKKAGHSLHLKTVRFLLDHPEYTIIKD